MPLQILPSPRRVVCSSQNCLRLQKGFTRGIIVKGEVRVSINDNCTSFYSKHWHIDCFVVENAEVLTRLFTELKDLAQNAKDRNERQYMEHVQSLKPQTGKTPSVITPFGCLLHVGHEEDRDVYGDENGGIYAYTGKTERDWSNPAMWKKLFPPAHAKKPTSDTPQK